MYTKASTQETLVFSFVSFDIYGQQHILLRSLGVPKMYMIASLNIFMVNKQLNHELYWAMFVARSISGIAKSTINVLKIIVDTLKFSEIALPLFTLSPRWRWR